MLGVTLFGVFLTPVFFRVVQWFGWDAPAGSPGPAGPPGPAPAPGPHPTGPVVS